MGRQPPTGCRVQRGGVQLAAGPCRSGGRGVGRVGSLAGDGSRSSLLRPQHQLPHRSAPHQPSLLRQGRRHAGRSGKRRPSWRSHRKACHLGRRRPRGVRPVPAPPESFQRPALLRGPHRLWIRRQAGAQLHRLHRSNGPRRGLHHGSEGRRGAARPVAGSTPRAPKAAAAPSKASQNTSSPAISTLPTSPCA